MRLRELLAARRARGEPWSDEVYERLVDALVRELSSAEQRELWMGVFAYQRTVWQHAYERTARYVTPLSIDLAG